MEAHNPVNATPLPTDESLATPGTSVASSEVLNTSPSTSSSPPPPPSVEETPTQLTTECGICMQNIPVMHTVNLACCGAGDCYPCYYQWFFKEPGVRGTCPNCREPHVMRDEVISKLNTALERNQSWAYYSLAQYYMGRDGVLPVNVSKGIEYYLRAYELGDLRALHYLGAHYGSGRGVTRSLSKCIEYLMTGSSAGIEVCSLDLAIVFSSEEKVRDDTKAVHYMNVACQQGSFEACLDLGQWYIKGQFGLAVDVAKGIQLIKNAANNGLQQAQFFLASHYFKNLDFIYTPLCIKYCKMALIELKETDEHYILNVLKPLSPSNRDLVRFMLGVLYTSGGIASSAFSVFDGYLWFKTYLKGHATSCTECVGTDNGCVGIVKANRNIDDVHRVMSRICAGCGMKSQEQLRKCSGCRVARFCTPNCQRAAWDAHKKTCKAIKEVI